MLASRANSKFQLPDKTQNMNFRTLLTLCVIVSSASTSLAQIPDDSPRMTPLVKVIAEVEKATVALFVPDPKTKAYGIGQRYNYSSRRLCADEQSRAA